MTEPRRLLQSSGPMARRLLSAANGDGPSSTARAACARALGLTPVAALPPRATLTGWKWLLAGGLASVVGIGALTLGRGRSPAVAPVIHAAPPALAPVVPPSLGESGSAVLPLAPFHTSAP